MEILYIWLEDYKNIKHQGFNFSSEFLFTCESKVIDNKNTISLKVEYNKGFIPNFFENPDIQNITAIIGQNGTGKTNILDFIKESLPNGTAGIESNSILIVKEETPNGIEHIIYYPKTYKIEFENLSQAKFKQNGYDNIAGKYSSTDYPHFRNTFFIHYSNVFDLRAERLNRKVKIYGEDEPISVDGFFNISTNSLLSSDTELYGNELRPKIDRFDAYKACEIRRNIEFVCSNFKSELGFEIPSTLYLTFIDYDEVYLNRNKDNERVPISEDFHLTKKEKNKKSALENIITELKNMPHVPIVVGTEDGYRQMFYNTFLRSAFFNFIRTNYHILDHNSKYFTNSTDQNMGIIDFFKSIQNNLTLPNDTIQKANNILKLYFHIQENINSNKYNIIHTKLYHISIPVEEKDKLSIERLVEIYIHSKSITDYLEFRWRNLSSGEQSMLTMLSRFYDLKNRIDSEDIDKKKDIIILIDEGDIYFHPEWQRKYLNIIINYIPKIFEHRKIQFILTSNAPFLASDLPNSNVIFLKKEKEGKTTITNVVNSNKMNQTFAANIHSLLSNSFFLENGLMGEFSILKLKKIHKKIKNKKEADKDYIKKHIDIIGEPLIKNQFQEMFENSFGLNTPENINEKIQRLQLELLEAQKQKRKADEKS